MSLHVAFHPKSNYQIGLFENDSVPEPVSEDASRKQGSKLLNKLFAIRAELETDEFLPDVESWIVTIRSKIRLTDDQRKAAVLYAVEKQQASTLNEIVEDTRLGKSIVESILAELFDSGILYEVQRLILGSGRQYYMIKSRREPTPEVNDAMFATNLKSNYIR